MRPIRDVPIGANVTIKGVVVGRRDGGPTMVHIDGVGGTGQWAVVGTAMAEENTPTAEPLLVYLAGPIDAVTWDEAINWRLDLAEQLPDCLCFLPPRAYAGASRETAAVLDRANRAIIRESDVLVATLNGPALGTVREIEYARSLSLPVILMADPAPDSLLTHDLIIVPNWAEVARALSNISPRPRERSGCAPSAPVASDTA